MIGIQQRIEKENLPIKMILQIHDELVFEMPQDDAPPDALWIAVAMTSAIQLNVPLKVDIAIGNSWLE
jgi:DNA polymerase-1